VAVRIAVCLLASSLLLLLGALAAQGAPAARAGASSSSSHVVFDLGDSLSVGTAPYLHRRLRGYRFVALTDVGLHAYDVASIVSQRRASLPHVIVVSAGTNDDPRIVSTFWRAVSKVTAVVGPKRCVVWPTIVRPPANGASYDGLNRVLERLAERHRNLVLVDWVGLVGKHPKWLSSDGVHPGVPGYRARAAAIATAIVSRCPS
jgi:lysophospholipase L1-like esterase